MTKRSAGQVAPANSGRITLQDLRLASHSGVIAGPKKGSAALWWAQGKRECGSSDDGLERVQLRRSFGAEASRAATGLPIPTTCSSTFQLPPADHLADPAARTWGQSPAQDALSRKARQPRHFLEVGVAFRKGDLAHQYLRTITPKCGARPEMSEFTARAPSHHSNTSAVKSLIKYYRALSPRPARARGGALTAN